MKRVPGRGCPRCGTGKAHTVRASPSPLPFCATSAEWRGTTKGNWVVTAAPPRPHLMSPMMACLAFCCLRSSIKKLPTQVAWAWSCSFSKTFRTASPTAQDTGLPPN